MKCVSGNTAPYKRIAILSQTDRLKINEVRTSMDAVADSIRK